MSSKTDKSEKINQSDILIANPENEKLAMFLRRNDIRYNKLINDQLEIRRLYKQERDNISRLKAKLYYIDNRDKILEKAKQTRINNKLKNI